MLVALISKPSGNKSSSFDVVVVVLVVEVEGLVVLVMASVSLSGNRVSAVAISSRDKNVSVS